MSVTADRDGNTIVYDIRVHDLEGVGRLSLVVGQHAEVTTVEGGHVASESGRTRVQWDQDSSLHIVVGASPGPTATSRGTEYFATDDWLLGRVPYVELRWWATGSERVHRQRPLGDRVGSLANRPDAVFGDRYALVGDQSVVTAQASGQQFRIVTPADTRIGPGTEAVRATLSAAAGELQVGDGDDQVLLLALPEPARRGGESVPARDEAWLRANSPVDDPNNVWLHEYVHTRQDFRLASDMTWFREASAEYYAARLTYEQGRISRSTMLEHIGGPGQSAVLSDPDTWSSPRVPYTKGARVLTLLDRNIRHTTDGQRSLEDVFRRMNDHEGRVTYTEFKRIVASVAGHSMDAWLDRYVAGDSAVASVYAPPVEAGFGSSVVDLLDSAGPGVLFLSVSTAFSVVAALPMYLVLRQGQRDWTPQLDVDLLSVRRPRP